MRKSFTYLIVTGLFIACAMNTEIAPGNISESLFGFLKRNIKKDRQELIEDMKHITKQGLIHFEIYDEAGALVTILKDTSDFDEAFKESFSNSKMLVKSVSQLPSLQPGDIRLQD